MKITKDWLQKNNACSGGVERFLSQNETDAAKIMLGLIECGRSEDSRWVMRKLITTKKQAVLIAVFAAECVLDIFEKKYPEDKRSRNAINAAKTWLKNPCKKTKNAAAAAADAAAEAADTAVTYAFAAGTDKKEVQLKIANYAIKVLKL